MNYQSAIVFGFNEYAKQIALQIAPEYPSFSVFVMNESEQIAAKAAGFEAALFDLGEDWKLIEEKFDPNSLIIFCALDKDAENVFLTISLRSIFENLPIIALASDHESAAKMKSAGANKVMATQQITANIITEMLEKPTVTEVLHDILYEQSFLKIAQITVPENCFLVGKHLHEIDWGEEFDILVLAIVDHQLSATFSFTSKGHHHHIDPDDVLVVVGYEDSIEALSEAMGVVK
ncbi:MAG: NAD-binding protein [Sulfuricurvum sp.]|uniref:NAD-binding protein n=1 Tax=Sulfuricurvum sp. TaxID=2025608 RepID=UPI00273742E7|nr:NAD-binding protein [Sulfuricurvum sp.]MDP2851685.1 NAD-binding protein [Sulfuricurvum sp.]MDP3292053.1 NAD-binding protein [Sulfuricurvum sp.]